MKWNPESKVQDVKLESSVQEYCIIKNRSTLKTIIYGPQSVPKSGSNVWTKNIILLEIGPHYGPLYRDHSQYLNKAPMCGPKINNY